jgi:hypothetical protein
MEHRHKWMFTVAVAAALGATTLPANGDVTVSGYATGITLTSNATATPVAPTNAIVTSDATGVTMRPQTGYRFGPGTVVASATALSDVVVSGACENCVLDFDGATFRSLRVNGSLRSARIKIRTVDSKPVIKVVGALNGVDLYIPTGMTVVNKESLAGPTAIAVVVIGASTGLTVHTL